MALFLYPVSINEGSVKVMVYAALFYLVVNAWLFILMGVDKKRSRLEQWRVPEKHLWLLAWIGGALGGMLGMKVFRHKTKP